MIKRYAIKYIMFLSIGVVLVPLLSEEILFFAAILLGASIESIVIHKDYRMFPGVRDGEKR